MILSDEIICRHIQQWSRRSREYLSGIYAEYCRRLALAKAKEQHQQFWQELTAARCEWELALKMQNEYTEPTLIDFGAYNIKACELRFRHLYNLARREGFSASAFSQADKE